MGINDRPPDVDHLIFIPSPQLKLPQIQKIMMEFERQSEIMDMKEEMMNDAIDDAMGDEDDEEERYGAEISDKTYFFCLGANILFHIYVRHTLY